LSLLGETSKIIQALFFQRHIRKLKMI